MLDSQRACVPVDQSTVLIVLASARYRLYGETKTDAAIGAVMQDKVLGGTN
jgi:hypothetical protein